ncbi:DUF3953 domain-containing protein [Viridibacillus sp. YIM B01967]|uniref:DUF3953 domain-containing protein n=1 Tax=Viridibacillus soli TaxID=2798301 RepID=A0ABS1H9Q8_9BACL|nr:DUF3953 domain-containing protein [Viridibacillus soli]MBK3496034.1 DUF3953 domain-containing protein [Viridibacillus soli]
MPYMLLFLGVFILAMGLLELQVKRKTNGIMSILASAFIFFCRHLYFLSERVL